MSTVLVLSVLVMLVILGLIMVWESEFILLSRMNYIQSQRAHIESVFTLYENHPEAFSQEREVTLYDSVPSQIKVNVRYWGLYEIVSMTATSSNLHQSRIMGLRQLDGKDYALYYPAHNNALSLSGYTNIEGVAMLPPRGVTYTQMESRFFSGKKLTSNQILTSDKQMPTPKFLHLADSALLAPRTFIEIGLDSIANNFYNTPTMYCNYSGNMLASCLLSGNIMLQAEKLYIDTSSQIDNIIVRANSVTVCADFKGSLQILATDSVIVEQGALLEYPSGIYAREYVELADNAIVNGYVIVDNRNENRKPKECNYIQSKLAKVRGLLYVNGVAQLQGIVSGVVMIDAANYFSKQGYYRNMIYNASMIYSDKTAFPLWIDDKGKKETIKWVN